jgi:flagellar hook-associated protein FlgK
MASSTIAILNSALQVNKRKMDIAMQNIANSDNEVYSAKEVEVSSIISADTPNGVKISKIRNNTDALMEKSLLNANAAAASSKYVSDISKEISNKLAVPGGSTNLHRRISEIEDAILNASLNPKDISLRNDLQLKAKNLANDISSTGRFLQEKRFEADQNLAASLEDVNGILRSIHDFNGRRMLYKSGSIEDCQLSDQMDFEIARLSKYFAIRNEVDSQGIVHIYLKNNGQEVVGKQLYSFSYTPQSSLEDFICDKSLNPLYLVSKSFNGSQENRAVIIDGYKSCELSYDFGGGLIDGLLEVRDRLTTNIAATLDQLAVNVADAFNKVHNGGNGLTAASSLTGTKMLQGSDLMIGSGNVIINPLDSSGKPIVTGESGKIPAMKLNLSQFTNNGLPGTFNVAGVVGEINNYFAAAATGKRLSINGFHTVNLAVTSSDKLGNVGLDFDLISYSTESGVGNMQFSIDNVNATDSSGQVIGSIVKNKGNFNINNGSHERTGASGGPSISLSNCTDYPVTISLDITTTVNGINTSATIEYVINAPSQDELNSLNGIINKRFTPNNIVSSSSEETKLLNPSFTQPIVRASIVDSLGREIQDPNASGFLKIENLIRGCGVAIDESDSKVMSSTNNYINGGFSYGFGMNDAFVFQNVDNPKSNKNIASFLKVSDAIANSPEAFSLGKMEEYRAGESSFDAPAIFYGAGSGDTSLVRQYQEIKHQNFVFGQTEDIGVKVTNIYDYASEIINVNNIRTVNLNVGANRNEQIRQMIANDLSGMRGVDIDDEAIKIVQYQKNYAMAAKFLNTTNNLLQTLIDNIN